MITSKTISLTIFNLSFCIYLFAQSALIVEEQYFTGSKFYDVDNYFGVTVVVNLTDGPAIYCMGLMINWNTNVVEGLFEYVVTTVTCLEQEGISEISVRIFYVLQIYNSIQNS